MDVLVFAAGRGTRLRPHTDRTPKPLLDVAGKPLLVRCLDAVVDLDVDRLVILVGYRADEVVERIGDAHRDVPITYVNQRERRGLAHAVDVAGGQIEGDVVLINGDNVFDADLSALLERFRDSTVDGVVLLDRSGRNAGRAKAVCRVDDVGGIQSIEPIVEDLTEPVLVAGGVQIHGPEIVDACRRVEPAATGEYELVDALVDLHERGRHLVAVELDGWHLNVNTPAELEAARRHFTKER